MLMCILCFQGEKVLQNDEFTQDLFRFLQLLCEGHNSGEWHQLRCQRKTTLVFTTLIHFGGLHLIQLVAFCLSYYSIATKRHHVQGNSNLRACLQFKRVGP